MDAILSSIILNIVSTKIYDTARNVYKKVTDSESVQKAIAATVEEYPQFDALQFALTTWCDSPDFSEFVERTRTTRLANILDDDIVATFITTNGFYSEDIKGDAYRILHTFLQKYLQAVYAGDQGQEIHALRDMVDHATTQAGIQGISTQIAGQAKILEAMQQAIRQVTPSAPKVQDAPPIPGFQEQPLQAEIDVARSLLHAKKQTPSNNLPTQVTSFIGREKEMEAVKSLLGKTRLLTLTASGGAGKTRLSLQLAAEVLVSYPDGAWLVELAPLADPAFVPQAVAQALGIHQEAGRPLAQTLIEFLKAKHLLLVLDNCEHVLDACARLADALLRNCPHVRVLASSRQRLNIDGELTYRIPSLSLPDPRQTATMESVIQYEAVRLFIERALFHLPAFVVTDANAPALASLCHRLDGIPLAIELAAARVRSLSVEEINSKLDNRFRLLTGGSRTDLPRHQTLRALIDWSYDLLNEQEKALLCRLPVFAGGWILEAAEYVGAEEGDTGEATEEWKVLDLLTSLVDKSLVVAEAEQSQTRHRLLETIRQYARERLMSNSGLEAVHNRHQDFYLTLAEQATLTLWGAEQEFWLDRMESEYDNLRAALAWGTEEARLRLTLALQPFWWIRGFVIEGREQSEKVLAFAVAKIPGKARADVLNGLGVLVSWQGENRLARTYYQASLEMYEAIDHQYGIVLALQNLVDVASRLEDRKAVVLGSKQALSMCRKIVRRALHVEGVENVHRLNGVKAGILTELGNIAYRRAKYSKARTYYDKGLQIRREIGDQRGIATSLVDLGRLFCKEGEYTQAHAYFRDGLKIRFKIKDRYGIGVSLASLAWLAIEQQQWRRSALLYACTVALRDGLHVPLTQIENQHLEHHLNLLRRFLDEEAFAAAQNEGRKMELEQAIAYALEDTLS